MYPRHSSRQPKASKRSPQRSPSPNEEVIQRRWRGKRQRTGLRETEADDNLVNTDEEEDRDIIDVINGTLQARRVAEEDEVQFAEVTDKGVDDSGDDCVSVTSSIASGPSVRQNSVSPKTLRPPQVLCSACKTLYYQKAKKMKAPIKSKLLDNDPNSLTCDQWVLLKSWRPRRLPNARGKLLIRVQLVKKRLAVNNGANRPARCGGDSPACSRPHAFLQRNLRRCVKVPVKKERRKRTRGGSQGRRVAKQQRLLGNNHGQRVSSSPTSGPSGSAGFEGQKVNDESDTNPTLELIPSTVTMETTKPREVPPEQKTPKKKKTTTGGFRDLLAQLRGNSSMIVRETR
ncbi:uncharacterized protein PEZ65_011691 isoform 2-T2 [Lycodopsis pacificus]